ncbi:ABC transporter substrate-binding protein [Nonomuraea sp. KM90]|uniref:ABC transporter substrate-binding protein n=1 Tax=Nonomuraea sp. KM90 TaxID=3457428 RepID=UPI003FCD8D7B
MRRLPRVITITALVATFSLPAGCGSGAREASPARPAADRVTYLTAFGTFGREAYAYVALDKGYFREAGLDVTVQPGQGSGENLAAVAGGRAHFAPVDFTAMLINAAGGKTAGVVTVAAIHQRTLAGLMALGDGGIGRPKDLEGKTVGDAPGSVITMMFPTYAKLTGVDPAKVKWVSLEPAQLPANLASGQVDAIGQYVVGQPTVRNAAKGKEVKVLPFGDVITDMYGLGLTTSTTLVKDKPDLVKRFTGALLKGLAYAVEHPREAAEILVKHHPAQNAVPAAAELTLMAPYVRPAGAEQVGAMDRDRVTRAIAVLREAGAFEGQVAPETVVSFDLAPKG